MKTKITFQHLWPSQLALRPLTHVIAQAFSCHRFIFAVTAFGLLALPLMASQPKKAQPLQNRVAVTKRLAASNRGSIPPANETKRGAAVTVVRAAVIPHTAPMVTNTDDSGIGSLRQALADAQNGDVITFNISPTPRPNAPSIATVITLTSGELVINNDITLSGPGADALTIARDANASPFRILKISSGHTVAIEGLTISGGLAQGSFPANTGGGIYNDHSTVSVNSCVLNGNSASFGGAVFTNALSSGAAALALSNSTVSNNSAANSGGGIFSDGENFGNATLVVNNSTFSGNSANSFAGGIYNDGLAGNAAVTITNSTFTGNSASSGGAIYMDGSNAGNAKLDIGNSIFNAGASGSNILNNGGTVISHGHNLSSDTSAVFVAIGDQIGSDPMLGPLKDNGGPTLTHAPLIDSPAIDQGKRTTIPALTTDLDQRGFTRPIDDPFVTNANGGDGSDIGAVELAIGVHPTNAASWKTHGDAGNLAIDLPLTGLEIECRSGGANNDYQMIVNFAQPVTFSSAAVISGVGVISSMSASSGTAGSAGSQVTINLTGVTNAQIITVALFDVDDGTRHGDLGVRMAVLVGDANDDGKVNASDVSQIKFRSGQAVDVGNVRADVIASGAINASDVSAVKSKSGTALP